uniref:Acireductone dioxygenase n=1 Tax=Plectus sambesii TaxID=2011161 RepID=A0A914UI97_9BILA
MVSAWFLDRSPVDQKLPNKPSPTVHVGVNELAKFGVDYYKITNTANFDEELNEFRQKHGYDYSDEITINKEKLPNYDDKVKMFYEEHIHTDDEVRYVVEGSGYFDVRNANDEWVRILVEAGDLLVLPAGIYHRFTVDTNDYIKVVRLFKGVPVWTAHNRPAEEMDARLKYVQKYAEGHQTRSAQLSL